MTKLSELFTSIFGESVSTPIPVPIGTQDSSNLVPNPNDFKNEPKDIVDAKDQQTLAVAISNIVDSLDDDDITNELADIIEQKLESVDPGADLTVQDACMLLACEDCESLYSDLTSYLDNNNIDYQDSDADSDLFNVKSFDLDNSALPTDLYASDDDTMGALSSAPAGSWSM